LAGADDEYTKRSSGIRHIRKFKASIY
jgi:hypothetical protein